MRGIALPGRTRRRKPPRVPALVADSHTSPRGLARLAAEEFPHIELPAAQVAAYRAAAAAEFAPKPEFHPAPAVAPETRALPVLREQAPADVPVQGRSVLHQLYAGLKGLNMEALDEAQRMGVTYAQAHEQARIARGRTPLGDAAARNFRPEVRPVQRHGEAVAARIAKLSYPPCDVTVPVSAVADRYDALMRYLDAITGTRGIAPGRRPLAEITTGSAA